MRKAKLAPALLPVVTPEDIQRTQDMGLTVMSYLDASTLPGADGRSYWYPRILAAPDLALIIWVPDDEGNYNFCGWEPQLGPHTFGGRRERLSSALAWVQRARDVRDGKVSDFRGV